MQLVSSAWWTPPTASESGNPPNEWMFPNVDLTIHLFRQPQGAWVGLDTSVVFGEHGAGLTSTRLHDLHGPVGNAEQILTIRPLS